MLWPARPWTYRTRARRVHQPALTRVACGCWVVRTATPMKGPDHAPPDHLIHGRIAAYSHRGAGRGRLPRARGALPPRPDEHGALAERALEHHAGQDARAHQHRP